MKIIKFAFVFVVAVVALIFASHIIDAFVSSTPTQTTPNEIRLLGYFKSKDKARYRTYQVGPKTTAGQIIAHANDLNYTAGRMNMAWYYQHDATVPDISNAASRDGVVKRIAQLDASRPWYVYMHIGSKQIHHDCTTDEGRKFLFCLADE